MLTWPVIKTISFLIVLVGIFLVYRQATSLEAQSAPVTEPIFTIKKDTGLLLPEAAFRVFDIETGEVLLEQDAETVLPIASVTKLVAASALLKNDILKESGVVTTADVDADGRAGKLIPGTEYTYRELLFPLLLESSNDAAAVFMRVTKGALLKDMEALTTKLQMKDTALVDVSGLSDKNVSTVADLGKFLTYLAKEDKHVLDITRLKQYVGPHTGWVNNSPVRDKSYRGGKHGYTLAADRTLVALFDEEFDTESRLLGYIILGSEDLASDTALLRTFTREAVTYQ